MIKTVCVVINKNSKNYNMYEKYIKAFDEKNFTYELKLVKAKSIEDELNSVAQYFDIIIIGGGDGTVRSATEVCCKFNRILGVLPLGTMNHFVMDNKLPMTPVDFINSLLEESPGKINVIQVNDKLFNNNASIGAYVTFTEMREYYSKKMHKYLSYIPALLFMFFKLKKLTALLNIKNNLIKVQSPFLMVSNKLYRFTTPISYEKKSGSKNIMGCYYSRDNSICEEIIEAVDNENNLSITVVNKRKIKISLDGELTKINLPLHFHIKLNYLSLIGYK